MGSGGAHAALSKIAYRFDGNGVRLTAQRASARCVREVDMKRALARLTLRDHAAALLVALATAHTIGLVDLAAWLPQGVLGLDRVPGTVLGAALCGLAYALVLGTLYRRRLVTGPLYRCAETRPPEDFGTSYSPGEVRLLDSWHYR